MSTNPQRTPVVLALALALALGGCSTKLGYVKDHPEVKDTGTYEKVKEWAYDVSDGYSSRGTINRYSLYWGAGMAAAGAGTLAGLGTTGASGNASVIVPLAAAFLGSVFGYYNNEEQAQLYFAASDSIKALIDQSTKRRQTVKIQSESNGSISNAPDEEECGKPDNKPKQDLACTRVKIQNEKNQLEIAKTNIGKSVNAIAALLSKDQLTKSAHSSQTTAASAEPTKTSTSGEFGTIITAFGKAVVETDAKIAAAHDRLKTIEAQQRNLDKYKTATDKDAYEAHCLTRDVNTVMRRVQIHLALLDPKHVSEDLLALKEKSKADTSVPPQAADAVTTNTDNKETANKLKFDLSDLDPNKIVSVCDVGV